MQVLSRLGSNFEAVTGYSSRGVLSARLLDGFGDAHAYMLEFDAGGMIGRHEAEFGQLLIVLDGRGWVSGAEDTRTEVEVGDVVYFERGEHHAKGSDVGMKALMVQVRDLSRDSVTARQ